LAPVREGDSPGGVGGSYLWLSQLVWIPITENFLPFCVKHPGTDCGNKCNPLQQVISSTSLAKRRFDRPGVKDRVTIAELAEQLQIVHHAAVELVDRLSTGNLVKRVDSLDDRRKVFVQLTRHGSRVLDKLAEVHRDELRRLTPSLLPLLESLIPDRKMT
jgi:hypothetical protein